MERVRGSEKFPKNLDEIKGITKIIEIWGKSRVKRGKFSPAPCSPAPLVQNAKNETALPQRGEWGMWGVGGELKVVSINTDRLIIVKNTPKTLLTI